jgi:hypothetical protein
MVGFPLMVSCGVRGDELHMSEPRWAAINRDEARLTATNRDQATGARTPYIGTRKKLLQEATGAGGQGGRRLLGNFYHEQTERRERKG